MRVRGFALVSAGVLLVACTRAPLVRLPDLAASALPEGSSAPEDAGGRRTLPGPPDAAVGAEVLSVTDGDTIVLRGIADGEIHRATGGRKARLIGVDTPEVFGPDECFGAKASSFTRAELDGTRVRIAFDVGRTDRYGRALVYVWDVQGRFFNARLVQEGYALQMTVPPNVRFAGLFTALAREARLAGRGLWREC
jgi:micrococcal nuclease